MKTATYEVRRARHTYKDHDHVHCAGCNSIVTGPHQATAQPKGKGIWARECSDCGVVTWYDVDNERTFTLDGESVDVDQFILDNSFDKEEVATIWRMGVGDRTVYGGGAFALFTLARIS